MGTSPMISITPCLAPCFSESIRLRVPGNRMLLPRMKPAAPEITMAEISSEPWIQITRTESQPNPFGKEHILEGAYHHAIGEQQPYGAE